MPQIMRYSLKGLKEFPILCVSFSLPVAHCCYANNIYTLLSNKHIMEFLACFSTLNTMDSHAWMLMMDLHLQLLSKYCSSSLSFASVVNRAPCAYIKFKSPQDTSVLVV